MVGESEKGLREIFQKARQAAPCIIFFDEIDALVPTRSAGASDSHVSERILSQFLAEFDGIDELREFSSWGDQSSGYFGCRGPQTGPLRRYCRDDDARPKRPGRNIYCAFRQKPLAEDIHKKELAERTEGFTGADIAGSRVKPP